MTVASAALSPALFLAAANALLDLRQFDPRRRESVIEGILEGVGLPGDARWSAAFIHHVGRSGHFNHATDRSDWPLPPTGSCNELVRVAAERHVLYEYPDVGDIAMSCFTPTGEYIQAGFVLQVIESGRLYDDGPVCHVCRTLEGNTDLTGGLDGIGVYRIRRTLVPAGGDRFIRWMELDERGRDAVSQRRVLAAFARVQAQLDGRAAA